MQLLATTFASVLCTFFHSMQNHIYIHSYFNEIVDVNKLFLAELRLQDNKDLHFILLHFTHMIPIKWLLLHALML